VWPALFARSETEMPEDLESMVDCSFALLDAKRLVLEEPEKYKDWDDPKLRIIAKAKVLVARPEAGRGNGE
jgi:hypothetical protein